MTVAVVSFVVTPIENVGESAPITSRSDRHIKTGAHEIHSVDADDIREIYILADLKFIFVSDVASAIRITADHSHVRQDRRSVQDQSIASKAADERQVRGVTDDNVVAALAIDCSAGSVIDQMINVEITRLGNGLAREEARNGSLWIRNCSMKRSVEIRQGSGQAGDIDDFIAACIRNDNRRYDSTRWNIAAVISKIVASESESIS